MHSVPLALSFYSVVVAFHVIFAVIGLGAAFAFPFLGMAAKASPQNLPFALTVHLTVMRRWIGPMSLLVLITGIYLVADGGYDLLDDVWISASLALFVIYMGLKDGLVVPSTQRALDLITKSAPSEGPPPAEMLAILQRNAKIGPVLGLLLATIVFLMETKPF
jgi:hypothetical protein